jgi:hypothetical protein
MEGFLRLMASNFRRKIAIESALPRIIVDKISLPGVGSLASPAHGTLASPVPMHLAKREIRFTTHRPIGKSARMMIRHLT